MLTMENITKSYATPGGGIRALDGVSLRVRPGQFTVVRGPSGCGKTTLLLAAGALLAPDAGRVVIGDTEPYLVPAEGRARLRAESIGFVFQQFHLIPYLTALENVLAPTLARPANGSRQHALDLLGHFGLADRTGHVPAKLSTGERQRTALARALINRPGLLLADEPTGNLDPDTTAIVLEYIAEFARNGGAVLMVTHDDVANQYADAIIHLNQGKISHP